MLKNISIALLLIVSGLLGWQFVVQQQDLKQREKMTDYYLDFHHKEIQNLAETMMSEVENEIANEGKLDNEGMIDTIKWILTEHDQKLRGAFPSRKEAENYALELDNIWASQLRPRTLKEHPFPETKWSNYVDGPSRVWRLMQLEQEVLSLFNGRLGSTGHCWGYKTELFFSPEQRDTIMIYLQDTILILVGKSYSISEENSFVVEFNHQRTPDWRVSHGWIENNNHFRYWCFDSRNLPDIGIFEATLSGKMWKATGGYEFLPPTRKIFKIVR